jgi:signal transduction histidine kinase/CheY-like chemotaxis protein
VATSPATMTPGAASGGELDHLRALFVQTPATLAGYLVGAAVVVWLFHDLAPRAQLLGWLAATALLWGLRLAHYLRARRRPQADDAQLRRWRRSWQLLVLAHGSLWGLAGWLFWGLGPPYARLGLILVLYSYCVSAVQLLGAQPRVFLGFIGVVFVPAIVRIATDASQPGHLALAVIATLLLLSTVLMARLQGSALAQAIALKARTDELASRLRAEMDAADEARQVAEEARRAAEAASRAKTQFFAAASHDLRQPLHAMGLFAEALRSRQQDAESAALVHSIHESVDALEGLFGELLDITRIDSGAVAVNPRPVPMADLFARLRLHFEPIAFEKGLALALRGGRHVAHADPMVLERVLRNLLSNAIRYCDDGGVLLSCRLRSQGGRAQLLLQVWDTGIGIPEPSLPRIFDEFYQAHEHRLPGANQRKGLGLGLAIVRRLADLMGAALSVRSRVGRGSVFSLLLPLGRAPRPADAAAAAPQALPALTLQGRRIVVVEDDAAVRAGLLTLLQAWGAQVLAFDGCDALAAWLADRAAERPDLALVDYRLPGRGTGLDALGALRARFGGVSLPAIVVTGSSSCSQEAQALAHDCHLLVKPVLPHRLRALIAFKLGVRPGVAAAVAGPG